MNGQMAPPLQSEGEPTRRISQPLIGAKGTLAGFRKSF